MSRLLVAALICGFSVNLQAQDAKPEPDPKLAIRAGEILRQNCVRCHKGTGSESGYAFNVLEIGSLTDEGVVVAGDHESSEIFNAMFSGRMPPKNRPQLPRPSPEDVDAIKNWISAGAAAIPRPEPRPTIELKTELQAIQKHLQDASRDDRSNLRYFTLSHLYNDAKVDMGSLQTTRMALAKVLNSLSWEAVLVEPTAINPEQTIYAVDISELGWTRDHWNTMLKSYPYALSYGSLDDSSLNDIDEDISDLRRDQTPVVLRADWMIAVASKPPLYYALLFDLELPELVQRRADPMKTANPKSMIDADLEHSLGVDVISNFLSGKAARSGYTESGVSGQNRLIERHSMKSGGFYWKSYDFKSSNRTAILSEFPLGPKFNDNPFNDLAFAHDGGEIIFSLPNGLQGYLLVDAKGNRIDAGPIEVVGDSLKTSGNEQIVAGVSCIACHRIGMIESPDDEVRQFSGAVNDARDHVRRLYPENEDFRKWLEQDRRTFVQSLQRAIDPFVDGKTVESLPEPVGEVSRRYHLEPMSLETVAAELHVEAARLRGSIDADPKLRELGLRVLLRDGGTIKRAAWESPPAFPLMKQTARQLGFDPR